MKQKNNLKWSDRVIIKTFTKSVDHLVNKLTQSYKDKYPCQSEDFLSGYKSCLNDVKEVLEAINSQANNKGEK